MVITRSAFDSFNLGYRAIKVCAIGNMRYRGKNWGAVEDSEMNPERKKKRKVEFFLSEEKIRLLINRVVIKLNYVNSFRESFKHRDYRTSLSLSLSISLRRLFLNYSRLNFTNRSNCSECDWVALVSKSCRVFRFFPPAHLILQWKSYLAVDVREERISSLNLSIRTFILA